MNTTAGDYTKALYTIPEQDELRDWEGYYDREVQDEVRTVDGKRRGSFVAHAEHKKALFEMSDEEFEKYLAKKSR